MAEQKRHPIEQIASWFTLLFGEVLLIRIHIRDTQPESDSFEVDLGKVYVNVYGFIVSRLSRSM